MTSHYEELHYGSERPEAVAEAETPGLVTRRRVLQGLAASGAAGYGAWKLLNKPAQPVSELAARKADTSVLNVTASATPEPQALSANVDDMLSKFGSSDQVLLNPAPVDQRILVLIELEGGNDGLSTVVPYATGAYFDRRPRLAIAGEAALAIDDEVGLNPKLVDLAQRQMATVEGVGPVDGNLSHFEMVERWDYGNNNGGSGRQPGFLARLADRLDVGAAVTGLSVAGHTPRFNAANSSTLALDDLRQLKVLTKNDWIFPHYRRSVAGISGGPVANRLAESWNDLFGIGRAVGSVERYDGDSPIVQNGGQLGRQLATAAEMIKANLGVRVIHARMGGFDTHDGHAYRHERLMERLNGAVAGFLSMMDAAGMADRVLVATSSEFGRRVSENADGLDHGAASSMLLFGPVAPGRYGDPSPISDLDRHGNLRTTIAFERYLATLAQDWLGIDAGAVLEGSPRSLGLFQQPVVAPAAPQAVTPAGS